MVSKAEVPNMVKSFVVAWVDIRDVALSHVKVLEVPEADGQRFVVNSGNFVWQGLLDTANELGFTDLKKGTPGFGKDIAPTFALDNTKARQVLGKVNRSWS